MKSIEHLLTPLRIILKSRMVPPRAQTHPRNTQVRQVPQDGPMAILIGLDAMVGIEKVRDIRQRVNELSNVGGNNIVLAWASAYRNNKTEALTSGIPAYFFTKIGVRINLAPKRRVRILPIRPGDLGHDAELRLVASQTRP